MYQYFDRNENGDIGLHDCRATKLYLRKDVLSFEFKGGFWVAADNRHNPYTRGCQTGPSRMDVRLLSFPGSLAEDNVICYVFEPKKHGKTVRKELSLKQLMHKMNEKGRGLEFLSAYQGYDSVILECVLDWKKKPYNRECVLILSTNDIVYRWNDFTVYNN